MLKQLLSFIVLFIGFFCIVATILFAQYYSWHCPQWLLSNTGESTSVGFDLVVIATVLFEAVSCIGTICVIQEMK